jgi:hypothetical protein
MKLESINLNEEKPNVGKLTYYLTLSMMHIMLFVKNVNLQDISLINCISYFVLAFSLPLLYSINNYAFNDKIISMLYRITLLISMFALIDETFHIDFSTTDFKKNVSIFEIFYKVLLSVFYFWFVGAILSFPFKLISYYSGKLDCENIYNDNTDQKDLKNKITPDKLSTYVRYLTTKNNAELKILLKNAVEEENYNIASLIRDELKKFKI